MRVQKQLPCCVRVFARTINGNHTNVSPSYRMSREIETRRKATRLSSAVMSHDVLLPWPSPLFLESLRFLTDASAMV